MSKKPTYSDSDRLRFLLSRGVIASTAHANAEGRTGRSFPSAREAVDAWAEFEKWKPGTGGVS